MSVASNRFSLIRPINSGRYGVVYKAVDMSNNQHVAVKKIPLVRRDLTANRQAQFRFERAVTNEIKHLMTMRGSPYIAQLQDVVRDDEAVYLVLELCGGSSLKDTIDGVGDHHALPLNPSYIRRVVWDVANALTDCHARDVLHADVKPANLVFSKHANMYKLVDFNSAAQLTTARGDDSPNQVPSAYIFSSTPEYAAPEVLAKHGEPVTAAYDIYALGKIIAKMRQTCVPSDFTATDPGLQRLESACLEPNPVNRPTAKAILEAVL